MKRRRMLMEAVVMVTVTSVELVIVKGIRVGFF